MPWRRVLAFRWEIILKLISWVKTKGNTAPLPSFLPSCLIIPSSYLSLSIFLFLSFFFPSFFFLIFYFFLSWVKFIPQLNFTQPSACAYWEVGHLSEEVTSTTHCKHSTELGAGPTWANHKIVVLVQFPNVRLLWTIEVVDKRNNLQNRPRWLGSFLSLPLRVPYRLVVSDNNLEGISQYSEYNCIRFRNNVCRFVSLFLCSKSIRMTYKISSTLIVLSV